MHSNADEALSHAFHSGISLPCSCLDPGKIHKVRRISTDRHTIYRVCLAGDKHGEMNAPCLPAHEAK